jgi:type I restriction enzyme S subunit
LKFSTPLGELIEFMRNGTTAEQNQHGVGFPVTRIETISQGVVDPNRVRFVNLSDDGLEKWRVQVGDILFSHINSEEHIGKSALYEGQPADLVHGMNLLLLRPAKDRVLPSFLHYLLRSSRARAYVRAHCKKAINQASINQKELSAMQVVVPTLAEQAKVVDLLARAEGIVRLRREAAAKAAELIPALFIHHFGDPATNTKGWPQRKVSDFVAKFVGGKNLQAGDGAVSPMRILKVSAVTSGQYVEAESKPAPNDHAAPPEHFVREGDLLFSRANTSELVGATALVDRTNGSTLLPDKVWRFVWREEVDPVYIWALFQSKYVRQELSLLASGTSDSMRNISQAKLFDLQLPLAPVQEQRRFGEQVRAALSIRKQQTTALAKAQSTFDALLAQAFAPT